MSRRFQVVGLFLVLGAVAFGVLELYRLRLRNGDDYPEYSSFRADPTGLRALRDSLTDLPGVEVSTWMRPISALPPGPPRTLVLAGFKDAQWFMISPEAFSALDTAVRNGCRLVIAIDVAPREPEEAEFRVEAPKKKPADPKPAEPAPSAKPEPKVRPMRDLPARDFQKRTVNLKEWWGIDLSFGEFRGEAHRTKTAPDFLPANLPWQADCYFEGAPGAGWNALYTGGHPMMMERTLGRGTIVVATDAYLLTNEALQRERRTSLLLYLVGQQSRVTFVETHLGVMDDPGVAATARRYGLGPAFFTLIVLAVLFVWSRIARFVPPLPSPKTVKLDYHPAAGLEALMRRSVPAADLVPTCAAQWRATARAGEVARADEVIAAAPRADPVRAYNAIVRALRRR